MYIYVRCTLFYVQFCCYYYFYYFSLLLQLFCYNITLVNRH